jgi:hypothetical protein
MAKYIVTHTCGHDAETIVFGKYPEQDRISYMSESDPLSHMGEVSCDCTCASHTSCLLIFERPSLPMLSHMMWRQHDRWTGADEHPGAAGGP